MLRITSYVYDWDDPVHGSTDGWDPARTTDGWLGKFTNETVTLTVDDWAPHTGLQLSSGGLNAWGSNTEHEVVVYVGEEAVYRYFTYRPNPQTLIYDEEPLGDYATLGYIPHTDSQVQLRFEGSGFNQADQYDRWFVMMYSIHAVQPVLESLTVTSELWSDETVTAASSASQFLDLAIDADEQTPITITAVITPDTSAAYGVMLYTIADSLGSVVESGPLSQEGVSEILQGDWRTDTSYTLRAGFDANQNGLLDGGEVSRTILMNAKQYVITVTENHDNATWNAEAKTLTISRPQQGADIPFSVEFKSNDKPVAQRRVKSLFDALPPVPVRQPLIHTDPNVDGNNITRTKANGKIDYTLHFGGQENAGSYRLTLSDPESGEVFIQITVTVVIP